MCVPWVLIDDRIQNTSDKDIDTENHATDSQSGPDISAKVGSGGPTQPTGNADDPQTRHVADLGAAQNKQPADGNGSDE